MPRDDAMRAPSYMSYMRREIPRLRPVARGFSKQAWFHQETTPLRLHPAQPSSPSLGIKHHLSDTMSTTCMHAVITPRAAAITRGRTMPRMLPPAFRPPSPADHPRGLRHPSGEVRPAAPVSPAAMDHHVSGRPRIRLTQPRRSPSTPSPRKLSSSDSSDVREMPYVDVDHWVKPASALFARRTPPPAMFTATFPEIPSR